MSLANAITFADLSLLTVALFWVAASPSPEVYGEPVLPISYTATASAEVEMSSEVETVAFRWFDVGEVSQPMQDLYASLGMKGWANPNRTHSDLLWNHEIIDPAPVSLLYPKQPGRIRCANYYWKVTETIRRWPNQAPVLIRADRLVPFKHISKFLSQFSRSDIAERHIYLATALPK